MARSGFRKKFDELGSKIESMYRKHHYRKSAKLRLKRMNSGYECDKEYKEIVVPYWSKYGIKPSKMWYKIFWDRDHNPDPRYIPDDLWYGEIVPYFSNMQFRRYGEDKCMHAIWFGDFKRPRTIVMNVAGVYYNEKFEIISLDEAIKLCLDENRFIIKPSIDSGEGRLIRFFDGEDIYKNNIVEAFKIIKSNFIVQDIVNQNRILADLNESSLNTIRIVSFLFDGEVHILSSILRIGAKGARVDNIGAGGYACPILDGGKLCDKGVNRKAEWVDKTNEGVVFKGITIPSYNRILEMVKDKHAKLSHFKLIGWDFSVDESNEPIFIEFNVCPGSNQISFGPTFGDLTDKVLDEVYIYKTLKDSQN